MGTDSQPLVSVLTPVYNMGSYLAECIESVLAQTYENFEYIIVNNCSTDNTLDVASNYANKDSRIRVLDNKEFVGVIENHNIAFRSISSKSKYCKVVSADDWIFTDCIRQMVELVESNPSVGIVGSYSIARSRIMNMGLEYERKIVSGRRICRETLLGRYYALGSPTSILYRADLVRRSHDFYPGSNPHADTTACYQWLRDSDFGFVHQVLSYTRVHAETQTTNSIKLGTISLAQISNVLQFGPEYLSEEEQRTRLKELMDYYYGFLASSIQKEFRNKAFWQHQKTELRKLGLPFKLTSFCKAIVEFIAGHLVQPRVTVRKIFRILSGSGHQSGGEGAYYE